MTKTRANKYLVMSMVVLMGLGSVQIINAATGDPFGTITNPIDDGSLGPGGGLIQLLNNVLRLVFVLAGIFAFIKIILAGLGFINAGGDAKKIESAWASIWQSLVGLIIIVSSIALAALVGLILFGNASAILSPNIYGPQVKTFVPPPPAHPGPGGP